MHDETPEQQRERIAMIQRIRDESFTHFLKRLEAAGAWLGLEEEAAAISVVMKRERKFSNREDICGEPKHLPDDHQ